MMLYRVYTVGSVYSSGKISQNLVICLFLNMRQCGGWVTLSKLFLKSVIIPVRHALLINGFKSHLTDLTSVSVRGLCLCWIMIHYFA